MKPLRRMDSTSQSCSCTSCLYKSESEQPSVRKYVAHGSRIDRLYYGKYIPLRERKLLNRLVRTRAVYDDLRARLISDSTSSLEKHADLRPGKRHQVIKTLDSEKSGAILELVDIIDKGAALDPKKLSECCSCCSCSSQTKVLERTKQKQRHKRVYGRTYEEEYGQMGQIGTGEGVYDSTYERAYGKTTLGRMGERFNKRGVRFKAKHIRSDPCTCTFKFSGLIKKHSKAMFRKIRPLPLEQPFFDAEEQYIVEKTKKQNFVRKSFQKYKELQDKLEQDIKRVNKSRANMKQNLQLHAKKSLEQAKQVKNKIKNNIDSGVRKSIQAVKGLHPKEKVFESIEYPEAETAFKIKKDSIVKFKDYLKKKETMKDWECDLECEPNVCVPDECFKIIKLRRSHNRSRQRDRKNAARYKTIHKEVKVGERALKTSNSGDQAGYFNITAATHVKKQKPVLRLEGKNELIGKRLIFESEEVRKNGIKRKVKEKSETSDESNYGEKAPHNIKKKDHSHRKDANFIKKEKIVERDRTHSRGRQAVRIKSSFSFDVEFYKNPRNAKTPQSNQPSGIHVRAPRHNRRKAHRGRNVSNATSKVSVESSHDAPGNLKTRLIQTDKYGKSSMISQEMQSTSKISQCECEKRVSNVKTNTGYVTKSVSSITNKSSVADKNISQEVKQRGRLSQVSLLPARLDTLTTGINETDSHHKQAVRIGSTFSFSIEFYKNNDQNEVKVPSSKEKVKQTRTKNRPVRHKLTRIKGTSTKAYDQAKSTLRRCFCTLKLHRGGKKKVKTLKTSTVMCLCETKTPVPSMMDKYVETKHSNRYETPKLYHLLPYQCEPGICIPGECDPIICKKILDLRKGKRTITKSIGSYTGSRQTKSTSSIMSRPFTSAKAKTVQSSIVQTKVGGTSAPRRYKHNLYLGRNEVLKRNIKASGRQAVRIGSSFSFNIEFYKDKQNPAVVISNKPSVSNMPPVINYKQRNLKEHDYNTSNKSMFAEATHVNKYIGPSLKRCLCTLKLYKNKVPRKDAVKKAPQFSANTQTLGETSIGESVDRGTRTKRERHYKLLPYECEPYICVPGECDPYICLENIKRRELTTRNTSAITDKPEMTSMSSLTNNSMKKSEAITVQPKLLHKGIKMKADRKPRPIKETFKASKSKQAVRIGSSFKFSIEFSKQLPGVVTLDKHPKIEQSLKVHPKINRDKGITVTKVRVDHVDTQALEPRKVNKAGLVRPMLKRCFCTLNLQKKTRQQYRKDLTSGNKHYGPKVYTVGRAMTTKTEIFCHSFESQINSKLRLIESKNKTISISTSSFLLNKYMKSLKSKYTYKIPINLKKPVIIKSNLSMEVDIMRQLNPFKESRQCCTKQDSLQTFSQVSYVDEKSHEYLQLHHRRPCDQNINKIIGINRYLERCFYTMNVQISKQGGTPGIKKRSNKLKPYECEPGICIPGECNPYECKKLIMKRLAKNVQKSSGTISANSTNKSISSYTGLDTRSAQIKKNVRSHSQVTIPQKYKTQRQHEPNQRQAVRLKSSFSFDLEFYKHRSQSFEKYVKQEEPSLNGEKVVNRKTYKTQNKGGQGKKVDSNDKQFQSTVTSVHTGTAPMTKRCFCTLKLQKKGRIHREHAKSNTLPAKQSMNVTSRNIKIGTTTKYQKVAGDSKYLKLYECEPGICVPGQCDPYKCLELMEHRKDLGINTIQKENTSVSSTTSGKKYKSHAAEAIPKKTHHKSTKALKYIRSTKNENPHISGPSSRSAVRIGSSFSFNVEFFKDVPQVQQYKDINFKRVKMSRNDPRQIKDKKVLKSTSSLIKKTASHKTTTVEKLVNQPTTTTSFMKRCFCTKNLRSMKAPDQSNAKNFKDKCFCLLGLLRKRNKDYQTTEKRSLQTKKNKNAEKPVQTAAKLTNTNNRHIVNLPHLESYECEPGVCVPGQCDPYMCEKIIQQKLAKQYSKKSETESTRTQSVSSSFGNHKRSKNERTQAQGQSYKKKLQHISKLPVPPSDIRPLNADKRLVRLGSSFSFNIEFYKENCNGSEINEKVKEVKTYPTKNIPNVRTTKENIVKSNGTETVSGRSKKSQIKKKTKSSGVSPLLKRCFCTLKLMNKPIPQIDVNKKGIQLDTKPSIITKSVETQSDKRLKGKILQKGLGGAVLSPYECEPFTCVPGECDPVECLKRIKKRQQQTKESGTITKYPKNKSIGNAIRMRNENLQVRDPYAMSNKKVHKTINVDKSGQERNCYNQPRQAVRIGSNFSFNIEFFKDIGNDLPKIEANYPYRSPKELKVEKCSKKFSQRHSKTQSPYFKHSVDSQAVPKNMQSTETAMVNLKRCFCTLALRNKQLSKQENNSVKIQSTQPLPHQSSIGNFLKKCLCTFKLNKVGKQQNLPLKPTVKYEIKGTSTKRRCVPQDCIKKPVRILDPYECEPYVCVPGECDPYECLKRIQRRQVRDSGTDYKRYMKNSATDSIKQPVTRSTKVQYRQKRKLNSRGTSIASKIRRHSKENVKFSSPHNTNRQVVRIGSNFSFNVEFFKDHVTTNTKPHDNSCFKAEKIPNIKASQLKHSEKSRTMTRGSISKAKRLHSKNCQCTGPKSRVIKSSTDIAPKRCFCTLKLLKNQNNSKCEEKLIPHTIRTKDKVTATKNKYTAPQELGLYECPPFMCIPGECNPYECLEKINRRGIMRKSCNVGTRQPRTSATSVGNRPLKLRAHKNQSQVAKLKNDIAFTPRCEPQSEILKSSRVNESSVIGNKRAVRIGSNFNFNVEFFKQKSQPAVINVHKIGKGRGNEESSKSHLNKNVTAGSRSVRHYNSRMDHIKLKDQASDAGNLLKRCFCTLQLQKSRQKTAQVKMHRSRNNIRYPQTFTVGRVAVEPFRNPKTNKARSTCIDPKLLNRNVGTKTDKKYMGNIELPPSQCDPSNCPDYQKKILRRKIENDMQTILPYTPSKFHKKGSKVSLSHKNKLKKIHSPNQLKGEACIPSDTSILTKGKRRLTAKKSKKSIPTKSLKTKTNNNSSFFCRCVRFFSHRSETSPEACSKEDNMNNVYTQPKQSKTKRQPPNIKFMIPPKKAKSFDDKCPFICPENTNITVKKYSELQSGDVENSITKTKPKKLCNNQLKSQRGAALDSKHPQMRVTFADTSEYLQNDTLKKKKKNKSMYSKSSTRSKLYYSCSVNDCPFKRNSEGGQQISDDFHSLGKSMKSSKSKKPMSYSESTNDCQYCDCCKRKIDTDEISKGGGDRRLTISGYKKDTETCPCEKESINNNERKLSKKSKVESSNLKYTAKDVKTCGKMNPLLELRLDSIDQEIINKDEVKEKIHQLSNMNITHTQDTKSSLIKTKHDNLRLCGKCLRNRKMDGANISIAAKGATNIRGMFGKLLPAKNNVLSKPLTVASTKPSRKPCICGSKKCATESKRRKRAKIENINLKSKTCVCGSSICDTESKKIKKEKERILTRAKRKAQAIENRKERNAVRKRAKIQEEKDEIRRLKRIKRNAELEKRLKKYKDADDVTLAVDSLIDIGKLGASTLTGALRYTTKSIYDPKVACERLCKKCRNKNPEALKMQLYKDYIESDTAATMRRLKMRCLFMKKMQSLREKLESNRFTHFFLHLADKDLKTRQFKPKPVRRVREPLDFQCSLYMASLRRRPYLSVYYKCPWFYPHFLTLLNVWRQFTDIMLFLLAVVVWSPCILCMEGCRALMCCFFCTG